MLVDVYCNRRLLEPEYSDIAKRDEPEFAYEMSNCLIPLIRFLFSLL